MSPTSFTSFLALIQTNASSDQFHPDLYSEDSNSSIVCTYECCHGDKWQQASASTVHHVIHPSYTKAASQFRRQFYPRVSDSNPSKGLYPCSWIAPYNILFSPKRISIKIHAGHNEGFTEICSGTIFNKEKRSLWVWFCRFPRGWFIFNFITVLEMLDRSAFLFLCFSLERLTLCLECSPIRILMTVEGQTKAFKNYFVSLQQIRCGKGSHKKIVMSSWIQTASRWRQTKSDKFD